MERDGGEMGVCGEGSTQIEMITGDKTPSKKVIIKNRCV